MFEGSVIVLAEYKARMDERRITWAALHKSTASIPERLARMHASLARIAVLTKKLRGQDTES